MINSFQFTADEAYCIFIVGNRTICWYDLKTERISRRLDIPYEQAMKLTVHSKGKICTIRKDYSMFQVFALSKDSLKRRSAIYIEKDWSQISDDRFQISDDGKVAVYRIKSQTIQFWEVESGKVISTLAVPKYYRDSLDDRKFQISNDGKMFVSGIISNLKPCIWEYEDKLENAMGYKVSDIKTINNNRELRSCCVHFETMRCGSVSTGGKIILWDLNDGNVLWEKRMNNNYPDIMSFSSDGKVFAYVDRNINNGCRLHVLMVYNTDTGTEVARILLEPPTFIKLSEHGKYCAVKNRTGLLTIWNLETSQKVFTQKNVLCVDIVGANLSGIKSDRKEVVDILKFNGAVIQ